MDAIWEYLVAGQHRSPPVNAEVTAGGLCHNSHIEEPVPINVDNASGIRQLLFVDIYGCWMHISLISGALVVVDDEVDSPRIENCIKLLRGSLGLGARHLRGDGLLKERRHDARRMMIV